MKLYIPEIGDSLKLTTDWTFDLYNEDRNSSLMEKVGDVRKVTWGGADYGSIPCTIPAGAVLKVDRIYIRKGNKEYSSITFHWKGEALPAKMEPDSDWDPVSRHNIPNGKFFKIPRIPIRFWAKLADVNNIEFDKV